MNAIKNAVSVFVFDLVADVTIAVICLAGFVSFACDKLREGLCRIRDGSLAKAIAVLRKPG